MAARIEPASSTHPAQVVDLRLLDARRLEALLAEETVAWRRSLEWEFDKSADLVRRFVDMHALNGCALIESGEVAGYAYYVIEEHKGLIGDLYVRDRFRTEEKENLLIGRALESLTASSAVRRIESQLMMIDSRPERPIPAVGRLEIFPRNFMRADLRRAALVPARLRRRVEIEPWTEGHQDPAAHLIAAAYAAHVDASINDQYRTVDGARRFLYNIVQYPGCGSFYRAASYAAVDPATGELCGISLASLLSAGCGHITQICVAPEYRGAGIGYALLRRSLATLRDLGCRSVSLTVTRSNREAVELYERVGFGTVREFSAYVWDGFRPE